MNIENCICKNKSTVDQIEQSLEVKHCANLQIEWNNNNTHAFLWYISMSCIEEFKRMIRKLYFVFDRIFVMFTQNRLLGYLSLYLP